MWFEELTGFREESPEQVRRNMVVEGERLRSVVNGREYRCGTLEIPTLHDLRERVRTAGSHEGRLKARQVLGNVGKLHRDPSNAGALFQVASQFNLLEMTGPGVTPEEGVGIYQYDRTQGPACAIAAGAGTIYRNYFVEIDGERGQTAARQIDCLSDLGAALGNSGGRLWTMRNGYALATRDGLGEIGDRLAQATTEERDELRGLLRVGIQWDTEVTIAQTRHTVTQVYCSALPVSYSNHPSALWEPFARLVLEAAYEATLLVAVLNARRTENPTVYLTSLGGGAFGNDRSWILAAMKRSLSLFRDFDRRVNVVRHRSADEEIERMLQGITDRNMEDT